MDFIYFINILLDLSQKMGYGGIVFLMSIESSFIPFPSEIVIPPAAYLASLGEMNIFLVILSGIIGSLIGATINYFLAFYLGRKIVYSLVEKKIFRFIFLDEKKVLKSEEYFLKHGNFSTFFGRFIPAVRQLISIPAGFSKMNFKYFLLFTFLGSVIWVIVLAFLGYFFGSNKDLLLKYYNEISLFFILLVLIAITISIFKRKKKDN